MEAQSLEQRGLLRGEELAVKVEPIGRLDAGVPSAMSRFDGVRAAEILNVASNGHFGDIELEGQIAVCIVPSRAEYFQLLLALFNWTHLLSPPFRRFL